MLLVTSDSLDPYWNLAAEDHLLDLVQVQGPTLFLWQSHDTVVVGKNQNPWRECNFAYLRDHEIQLARRISGGGTVYHDAGNLNYAFFCARDRYRQDDVYAALIGGLQMLGAPAERMGKSSLTVQGRKISGNAFCYRRSAVMQHGTLLVTTDLERLAHSLTPPELDLDTRAVASEPAEVVNLGDLNPAWDINQVGLAVAAGFEDVYGPADTVHTTDDLHPGRMLELHTQFCSDDWRLGKSPRFEIRLRPAGDDVRLEVTHGKVSGVKVAVDGGLPWPNCLGARFRADDLATALADDAGQAETIERLLTRLGL